VSLADVPEDAPADGLAQAVERLRRLRRRAFPPGSWREAAIRLLYAPVIALMPRKILTRVEEKLPLPVEITWLQDPGVENLQARRIERIVIFKLDHIGDLVLGMRAFRRLREGFPAARITLVCASWNRGLAHGLGIFDDIVEFDFFPPLNRDWQTTLEERLAICDRVAELGLGRFDLAIDLRHDADTRPCLARVDAALRAGFAAPSEPDRPGLDLMLPVSEGFETGDGRPNSLHAELRLDLLAAAVVSAFATPRPHPALFLLRPDAASPAEDFAVLALGAGDPIRAWPIARYAEVARELIARHGLSIVLLGGPPEEADAAALAAALPAGRVRSIIGQDLQSVARLLAQARLCVSNGSGMSHLAAALGVPTLTILGGTTRMEVWHPAGPNALSIGGRTMCQPCGLKLASQCEWGVTCLRSIQPEQVLEGCARLLGARLYSSGSVVNSSG